MLNKVLLNIKMCINDTKAPFLVLIGYAIFTLIGVFHHEIWCDEAQAFMIAKYAGFFEMFKHLENDGHPCVFFLILMPFAKIFQNIIWLKIICWLISCFSVFLLWKYSDFSVKTKSILTLSAPFIYIFPIVSRNYTLIPLFCFLLAIFYKKNEEHPFIYAILILLLSHTHVLCAMFCLLLGADFFFQRIYKKPCQKKFYVSFFIILSGFVALFFQLWGTPSSNVMYSYSLGSDLLYSILTDLIFTLSLVFRFFSNAISYFGPLQTPFIITLVLGFLYFSAFIYAVILLYKTGKKWFYVFLISFLYWMFIHLYVHSAYIFPFRIYIMHTVLIFCFWMVQEENNSNDVKMKLNQALSLLFLFLIPTGFYWNYLDYKFDYTNSENVSELIKKDINLENSLILTDFPQHTVLINYYVNPDLYVVQTGKPYTYVRWGKYLWNYFSPLNWLYYAKMERKVTNKEIYIITPTILKDLNNPEVEKSFEVVFIPKKSMETFEKFFVYKFKG